MTEEETDKRKAQFGCRAAELRTARVREGVLIELAHGICDRLAEEGVTPAEGCKVRAYAEKIWGAAEAPGMFGLSPDNCGAAGADATVASL